VARHLFADSVMADYQSMSVLLHRLQLVLNSDSDVPLIKVTSDSVSLIEDNVEIDFDRIRAALNFAVEGDEPIRAIHTIAELLSNATGEPLSGLDHPLVSEGKDAVKSCIFEALHRLAQSPMLVNYRTVVFDSAQKLQSSCLGNVVYLESILRSLARLGEKELMINIFMNYEERLADGSGETPSTEIIDLLDTLLSELDTQVELRADRPHPVRPEFTIGRETEISGLMSQINDMAEGAVLVLSGLSGIGKSHLLKEVYFSINTPNESLFLDLDNLPIEVASRMLSKYEPRFAFIDHLTRAKAGFIPAQRVLFPRTRFICTTIGRLPMSKYRTFVVPALPIETHDGRLGAIDLLQMVSDTATTGTQKLDLSRDSYIELARLCDGIPLALTIVGKLCSTVGPHYVLSAMRRSLESIESRSGSSARSQSVAAAVAASLDSLDLGARDMVTLLATLQYPCPVPLFCQASDSSIFDMDEILASGLAFLDTSQRCIQMPSSISYFVRRNSGADSIGKRSQTFYVNTVAWFEMNCSEASNREMIVEATQLAFSAALSLMQNKNARESINLLMLMREFLGGKLVSRNLRQELEKWLLSPETVLHQNWLPSTFTLIASHFHAGDFDLHRQLVKNVIALSQHGQIEPSFQAELEMQLGLSWRIRGEYDRAIEAYNQALILAKIGGAKRLFSKVLFNLAMAHEAANNLTTALEYVCEAQDFLDDQGDTSVVGLIELSIARIHFMLGTDHDFVRTCMENSLAKALFSGNRRIVGDIIQNLGLLNYYQGHYLESAVHETVGTLIFLESGFTNAFRLVTKSSLVTLCASWFHLGNRQMATATQMMIDRMDIDTINGPNKKILEEINELTNGSKYIQVSSNAKENEVWRLLNDSLSLLRDIVDESPKRNELRYVIDLLRTSGSPSPKQTPRIGVVKRKANYKLRN
jgi:tetratricopeptide (TPR) repeat protein